MTDDGLYGGSGSAVLSATIRSSRFSWGYSGAKTAWAARKRSSPSPEAPLSVTTACE